MNRYLLFAFTLILPSLALQSKAVLQVAYGVEENQLILKSLDSSISHFGDIEDKAIYKRCLDHYLEFLELNMRRNDDVSYQQLRRTQKLLIPLYDRILSKNIQILKTELNRLGRLSKDKENPNTKAMLRLGFRDLAEADQKLTMARNIRPQLYLLKLREMLFALKILKHSGRFVIALGLVYDAEIRSEIEDFSFEGINREIENSFVSEREKYLKMHWDNHFKVWNADGIYTTVLNGHSKSDLSNPLPGIDPAYVREKR